VAPRYIDVKTNINFIIARQNSGLKFQDIRIFRGMNIGSDH
jgi:hypothetical protein